MIDRTIRHQRGRLINTYLISRLMQFITSMTTRVLCFFSGSINHVRGPVKVIKTDTLGCHLKEHRVVVVVVIVICENMKIRRFFYYILLCFSGCYYISLSLSRKYTERGNYYYFNDLFSTICLVMKTTERGGWVDDDDDYC